MKCVRRAIDVMIPGAYQNIHNAYLKNVISIVMILVRNLFISFGFVIKKHLAQTLPIGVVQFCLRRTTLDWLVYFLDKPIKISFR